MTRFIEGVVHGRTIELRDDPGLAEGQRVKVAVEPVNPTDLDPEERRRRLAALAGSLAHLPEEDWEALDEIIQDRQRWTHRELPE
ncbi:hypothetical protein BH23PLA1_BH23PLA1_33040 [soil metagenome]